MQSSARKNGLEQGFHGFTLHSYLLCIGVRYAKLSIVNLGLFLIQRLLGYFHTVSLT